MTVLVVLHLQVVAIAEKTAETGRIDASVAPAVEGTLGRLEDGVGNGKYQKISGKTAAKWYWQNQKGVCESFFV